MKRIRLAILLLLIPLCCIAFAALTKTTSIVELDAWEYVAAGTLDVGAAGDIHLSYDTILYLEIAYTDTDAQDGVDVSIEVSYGDDDWTLLQKPFTTPAGAAQDGDDLDGNEAAGQTVITLTTATNFGTPGQKWFIWDITWQYDSESVRTKSIDVKNVTLVHDTLRAHLDESTVWEFVHEYVIPIPAGFAYVRVLINNTDADGDVFYTTRLSKVTAL